MKSLTDQFLDWVETMPEEETFDPRYGRGCAGYQFLRSAGLPVKTCGAITWLDHANSYHQLPDPMAKALCWAFAQGDTVTFGALAQRLRA